MNTLNQFLIGILFISVIAIWFLVMLSPIKQQPELIYTKDGCSTYRFYDKGTRNYYTNCEK